MFTIHGKVELLKRDKQALGGYPRHHYDFFQLSEHSEVGLMLRLAEYAAIKTDDDQISRAQSPRSYFFPEGTSFARIDAFTIRSIPSLVYHPKCTMAARFCNGEESRRAEESSAPQGMEIRTSAQYNLGMADRIACSCVTCPKCGTWVVVRQQTDGGERSKKFKERCPVLECGKEFEFEAGETRVFEVPLSLFERRHFYRSELHESASRHPRV